MKKHIFSMLTSLGILLSLAVPALAADDPEPTPEPGFRPVKVEVHGGFTYGSSGELIYDGNNMLPSEIALADGGRELNTYDDDGRMLSQERYNSDGSLSQSLICSYGDDGNILGVTGTWTEDYEYDAEGRLLRETMNQNGVEAVTEYVYGSGELPTGRIIDGVSAEYAYNDQDQVIAITSENSTEEYTYDDQGRMITQTLNGVTHTYTYAPGLMAVTLTSEGTPFYFNITIADSEGRYIHEFVVMSSTSPEFVYDDNGCLVKLDGGDDYIEIAWEPVP